MPDRAPVAKRAQIWAGQVPPVMVKGVWGDSRGRSPWGKPTQTAAEISGV